MCVVLNDSSYNSSVIMLLKILGSNDKIKTNKNNVLERSSIVWYYFFIKTKLKFLHNKKDRGRNFVLTSNSACISMWIEYQINSWSINDCRKMWCHLFFLQSKLKLIIKLKKSKIQLFVLSYSIRSNIIVCLQTLKLYWLSKITLVITIHIFPPNFFFT